MPGSGLTVGGWFAVSVIATFVSKARSILEDRHELLGDVMDMLFNVEASLMHIQAIVDVAERRPVTNRRLTIWIQKIKEIASEAEDLLDDFEAKRIQKSQQNKVSGVFVGLMENLGIVDGKINKLKSLLGRLEKIASKAGSFLDLLKLNDLEEDKMGFLTTIQPVFYGREVEMEQLMNIICPSVQESVEESRMQEEIRRTTTVRVLCIVGEAGVGKTTLAQVIYNHPNVKEAFDLRGWTYLSHNFDPVTIFKSIVSSFAAEHQSFDSEMAMELLQEISYSSEDCLPSIVQNKKFILVLDNAQDNLPRNWKTLCSKLTGAATGSLILVTTRSEVIAQSIEDSTDVKNRVTMGAMRTETLSTILKHHAFGTNINYSLEPISEKIAAKLNGLPLLAEAIGRLLRMKLDEGHWQKISDSEWWDNYDDLAITNPSLPSVTIIFEFLSDHLKKCLGYCSMFPRGYLFERNKLVHMWMSDSIQQHHDFLYDTKEIKWFDELLNRSLIQPTIWKNKYIMHDVIKEFVASITQIGCYAIEESSRPKQNLHDISHLAIYRGDYNLLLDLRKYSNLRTILLFGGHKTVKLNDALASILPQSSAMRVLDLSCIAKRMERPPDVISTYSHLRYLDLSFTGITMLPDSFCGLHHLRVLGMRGCQFKELPRGMKKLVNLRYLYAEAHTVSLIHKIGQLTNLQGLEEFAAGEMEGHRITELKDLNELGGQLCISNLDKVKCIKEASDVKLFGKIFIQKLVLRWNPESTISNACMQTLSQLKPNANLEELEINYYMGAMFPVWVAEEEYFTALQHIKLSGCENLEILPPLGQLYHLKILMLQGLKKIENIGSEFYGNHDMVFPSLEELKFYDMTNWKNWLDIKASQTIPQLRNIVIKNCRKLGVGPMSLRPFLESIVELKLLYNHNTAPIHSLASLEVSKAKT